MNTSEVEFDEPSDSLSSIHVATNQTSVNDSPNDTILSPDNEIVNRTVQQKVWQGALWTGSK